MRIWPLFLSASLLATCGSTEVNDTQQVSDAFNNQKTYSSIVSSRGSYDSSLVHRLYAEAIEEDSQLEDWHDQIREVEQRSQQLLDDQLQFINKNAAYHQEAETLARQISDSVLANRIEALLQKNKLAYQPLAKNLTAQALRVNEASQLLSDTKTALMLCRTLPKLQQYQQTGKNLNQQLFAQEKVWQKAANEGTNLCE